LNRLLEGIRILDLSMWFAGPMASRLLADMGAEVIKIESLNHIDPWRGPVFISDTMREQEPDRVWSEKPYNSSPGFNLQNRNKYGITLDMSTTEGKEIFRKLVGISDVVLENYSPRVMANFGLDYPQLQEINHRIIMVSLPAMGRTGPDKDFIAFGQTIDCMSGMAYLTGYPGEEPMLQSGLAYGDPLSGMNAALAVVMALRYRHRSGKGMHIELSQVEGVISFNADSVMDYTMNKRVRGRMGNRHPSMAPHGYYRCKGEDAWVAIAIDSDETWQAFCKAIEQPPWAEDVRFLGASGRHSNQDELDKLVESWTLQYTHYDAMCILQEAGVPSGPVLDAKELLEDPHLNERGLFQITSHPEAGLHPEIGPFASFSKTPIEIHMPAPCLGEHNTYVFGQLLGMSTEEIKQLEKQRIIGTIPSEVQQGGMY